MSCANLTEPDVKSLQLPLYFNCFAFAYVCVCVCGVPGHLMRSALLRLLSSSQIRSTTFTQALKDCINTKPLLVWSFLKTRQKEPPKSRGRGSEKLRHGFSYEVDAGLPKGHQHPLKLVPARAPPLPRGKVHSIGRVEQLLDASNSQAARAGRGSRAAARLFVCHCHLV